MGARPLLGVGVVAAIAAAAGRDVAPGAEPRAVRITERDIPDRGRGVGGRRHGQGQAGGGSHYRRAENDTGNTHESPHRTWKGTRNARVLILYHAVAYEINMLIIGHDQ